MACLPEPRDILPHRYPFLMVDRIVELVPGQKAVGIKNVSINEPYFSGHFPDLPIMPGVLILEAMAQVGACALLADNQYRGGLAFLAGIDRIRFKKKVVPGDTLMISVELLEYKMGIGKAAGRVMVGDDLVCGGQFMFGLVQGDPSQ